MNLAGRIKIPIKENLNKLLDQLVSRIKEAWDNNLVVQEPTAAGDTALSSKYNDVFDTFDLDKFINVVYVSMLNNFVQR